MSQPVHHVFEELPPTISPSSHAAEANGIVFLTGQIGRDLDHPEAGLAEGIEAQTELCLRNMGRVLALLGLSLEHVLSVRVFLAEFDRDYDAMNRVYRTFFEEGRRPTRTCVGVAAMARGALVEIECVAARP